MDEGEDIIGILLAAGKGSRFDPACRQNKLTQMLPNGEMVAVASAKNLLSKLSHVIAVVRPEATAQASALEKVGCKVVACPFAEEGMGMSLAYALSHARNARGWVIALADMPMVNPQTIHLLAEAIVQGAAIAAPLHDGRRGNPVAFGAALLPHLLQLKGDKGARDLLKHFPIKHVTADDPGIHMDIDTPADLLALHRLNMPGLVTHG